MEIIASFTKCKQKAGGHKSKRQTQNQTIVNIQPCYIWYSWKGHFLFFSLF